jgi:hypothetical protein
VPGERGYVDMTLTDGASLEASGPWYSSCFPGDAGAGWTAVFTEEFGTEDPPTWSTGVVLAWGSEVII